MKAASLVVPGFGQRPCLADFVRHVTTPVSPASCAPDAVVPSQHPLELAMKTCCRVLLYRLYADGGRSTPGVVIVSPAVTLMLDSFSSRQRLGTDALQRASFTTHCLVHLHCMHSLWRLWLVWLTGIVVKRLCTCGDPLPCSSYAKLSTSVLALKAATWLFIVLGDTVVRIVESILRAHA
jgi:hypothetical protein